MAQRRVRELRLGNTKGSAPQQVETYLIFVYLALQRLAATPSTQGLSGARVRLDAVRVIPMPGQAVHRFPAGQGPFPGRSPLLPYAIGGLAPPSGPISFSCPRATGPG